MPPSLIPLLRLLLPAALAAATAAQTAQPLDVRGLPAEAPLTVAAAVTSDALHIEVVLQPGWHLYSRDVGGGQPVVVRVLDGTFAAAGPLATPANEAGLITGAAKLTLPLRRTAEAGALRATMSFMVCDALQCLPPIELELRTPLSVLLVAVDDGERTQRIAAFLRERGLQPTVTTYAAVTTDACDAHEVVIADSPTFHQVRGKKVDVKKFPKTASPVVAVGFLGTQLLAAHKVTMACGYI